MTKANLRPELGESILIKEGDLSLLKDKTIGIIGYGNQGRAQGRVLRDLYGMRVIVGNIRDASWERAIADGFETYPIKEASERSDVIMLLIPDEVVPKVYYEDIEPAIRKKGWCLLDFASGYNITYSFIKPPPNADIIMVAPRMIGEGILRLVMEEKRGYPVLIGVAQDVSGKAWDYATALAKGIGAFLPGGVCVRSSFEEETLLDLFTEHCLGPQIIAGIMTAFEVLTEEFHVSPEAALLELYASGEWSEVFRAMAEVGFFEQMRLHSRTSQYGQFTRAYEIYADERHKSAMRKVLRDIADGKFAKEWALEQLLGYPVFNRMWNFFAESKMAKEEKKLYKAIGRTLER